RRGAAAAASDAASTDTNAIRTTFRSLVKDMAAHSSFRPCCSFRTRLLCPIQLVASGQRLSSGAFRRLSSLRARPPHLPPGVPLFHRLHDQRRVAAYDARRHPQLPGQEVVKLLVGTDDDFKDEIVRS